MPLGGFNDLVIVGSGLSTRGSCCERDERGEGTRMPFGGFNDLEFAIVGSGFSLREGTEG